MAHFISLLLATFLLRPYVFAFVACFLFLAVRELGVRRAALFTLVAYTVALACEWSSAVAGTGFPFGLYRYLDATRDRELWVAGVPFMDSLSFTFLSYLSWRVAVVLREAMAAGSPAARFLEPSPVSRSWKTTFLAGLLMVCLDLIIDPVTLLGDRWFLGKIYYYPSPGPYFGVTLENFAGWFVVCVAILRLYFGLESRLLGKVARAERAASLLPLRVEALAPVAAYFGVMVFNLAVTFWIGEPLLGGVSCLVAGSVLLCVTLAFRSMEAGVRERRPAWTERPALSPLAGAPGEGRRQRAPEM